MSIASRQVTREMNRIVETKMKEGYIPTVEYITSQIGLFYSTRSVGSPFFSNRKLGYRKVFDINVYNSNLSEIHDDLNNLYEELVDQFSVVLKNFDYYDTERQRILHNIRDLESRLTDLVLVSADTEGYVYSMHDSFIDRSKVDMSHSSCEINTESGCAMLRESLSGINKVDMSHYADTVNFPIVADSKYAGNIKSNTIFPMSKFGYAFSDIGASWAQNIVTNKPGELQVGFIVDLTPGDENGAVISRIEMKGQSPKPMYVEPLYSIDNINFVSIPINSNLREKKVADRNMTIWNFSETRARYVKFLVRKSVEDEQVASGDSPAYRYVIGFKAISFYKMGYDRSSVLYSTPFYAVDPGGEALTIDKASIVVDSDVQIGSSITYFLSLGSDTTDDPTQFNWAPVSPSNEANPSEQQIVDFKHIAFFNNVPEILWDSGSFGTAVDNYYGIPFYIMYRFPYEPIKDSVEISRGKDDWQVTEVKDVRRKSIFDERKQFGSSDTVTLTYPDFTPVEGDGLIRGSVRVKNEPGQNPSYWHTTPGDFSANYTSKVITRSKGGTISPDPASPSNIVYVDYQYDEEIAKPTIYTTKVYVLNPNGINVNHIPFNKAETDAGQFTKVTTNDGDIDFSTSNVIRLSPGWHKVTTTGKPESQNDRFYSVNGNKYLKSLVYQQFAYAEKLQETSWFDLKYNTLKSNHSKYAVVDVDGDGNKEIVINYRPQETTFDSSQPNKTNDLLCQSSPEKYVLSYKFITTATNKIYFKAAFNRDVDSSASATPTLRSYTIKLGY